MPIDERSSEMPQRLTGCYECGRQTTKATRIEATYENRLGHQSHIYIICTVCATKYVSQCNKCKINVHHSGTMSVIDSSIDNHHISLSYCFKCFDEISKFNCIECRNSYILEYRSEQLNVCKHCYSMRRICEDCGNHYSLRVNRHCEVCAYIMPYSSDPPKFFYYGSKDKIYETNKLYLGIELEMTTPFRKSSNEFIELVKYININLKDFVYIKLDSSINENHLLDGIECITHPSTLEYLKNNLPKIDTLLSLRHKKCRSYNTETCGMHVHLSREFFTRLDEVKLFTFFQREKDFIVNISQRTAKRLNQWSNLDHNERPQNLAKGHNNHSDRYRALNTERERTIELRIFRGTLYPPSFLKNVEFADSLRFVQSCKIQEVNLKSYLEFILTNRYQYPYLLKFIHTFHPLPDFKVKDALDFARDMETAQETPIILAQKGKK